MRLIGKHEKPRETQEEQVIVHNALVGVRAVEDHVALLQRDHPEAYSENATLLLAVGHLCTAQRNILEQVKDACGKDDGPAH